MMVVLPFLLVLVAAVVAIPLIAVARRRQQPGTNSPVLVITYLILVVASFVATSSFSSLVESILPGEVTIFEDVGNLALTLSSLIVAGLVWGSVWLALEKRRSGPSTGRSLYLALTASIAMTVIAYDAVRLLGTVFGVDNYEPATVADAISFGVLWLLMVWWRGSDDELDDIRLFWGSLIGVSLASAGMGLILALSLESLGGGQTILVGQSEFSRGLRWGMAVLLVGAAYFLWFWLRGFARKATSFRNGYAAAVAVFAWFGALHALAIVVFQFLQWVLRLTDASFAIQFRPLPAAIATIAVGGVAYWHHRAFLGRERTETVRAVEYIFGGYSLAFFAGTLAGLLALLSRRAFGSESVISDFGDSLLGTFVALAFSGATTVRYWGRALRLQEPQSPSRRVALLVLFFGSAITGAIVLVFVLFTLLRSVLAGGGEELAEPLSIAVPIMLIAGALCWHIVSLRRQLRPRIDTATPAPTASTAPAATNGERTNKVVTVVASDPGPLPAMIEGMRFLRRADGLGVVSPELATEILTAINDSTGRAVVVTVDSDGYRVVPLT